MPTMSGQEIIDAIAQEHQACDDLAALRIEQRLLIEAGDAEALLEVLSRKQQTIDLITQLESKLKPIRAEWETIQSDFPAGQRFSISDGFREIGDALETLIAQESEDADMLSQRKDQVQDELDTLGRKRRLESVYRSGAGANVRQD